MGKEEKREKGRNIKEENFGNDSERKERKILGERKREEILGKGKEEIGKIIGDCLERKEGK